MSERKRRRRCRLVESEASIRIAAVVEQSAEYASKVLVGRIQAVEMIRLTLRRTPTIRIHVQLVRIERLVAVLESVLCLMMHRLEQIYDGRLHQIVADGLVVGHEQQIFAVAQLFQHALDAIGQTALAFKLLVLVEAFEELAHDSHVVVGQMTSEQVVDEAGAQIDQRQRRIPNEVHLLSCNFFSLFLFYRK